MQLAALVGYELLVVILAVIVLACLVSASVAGIFTRLSRGRVGRDRRETPRSPPSAR
jgi:hypothetical protein